MGPEDRHHLDHVVRRTKEGAFAFNAFLEAWNHYFSDAEELSPDLERQTVRFLKTAGEGPEQNYTSPQVRRMLSAFPTPAFLVGPGDTILYCNIAAMEVLKLEAGDTIDALPYDLQGGADLSSELTSIEGPGNQPGKVRFLLGYSRGDDRVVSIAVMTHQPSSETTTSALVFVIDPKFSGELSSLLIEAYSLTTAEAEVLLAFLQGANADTIAAQRGTSRKTVRTQFQSILSKAGVSSQAELMRNAFALAQFQMDLNDIADVAAHPYRKTSMMLRPDGRNVEVTLAGDLTGDLVVVLPDMTLFTFPASIEARFAQEGLCVATLSRPGTGQSDPVPEEQHVETVAADLMALLDQFGRSTCVLVGNATSSQYAYMLGVLAPDLISRIVLLRPVPPGWGWTDKPNSQSPLPRAIVNTFRRTPHLINFFARASLRSTGMIGVRNWVSVGLRSFQPDVDIAMRPEVLAEFELAYNKMIAQGYDTAVYDLHASLDDWSSWIPRCPRPVVWFQGTDDPIGRLKSFHVFGSGFETQHELVQITGAGYMAFYTHLDIFIDALRR